MTMTSLANGLDLVEGESIASRKQEYKYARCVQNKHSDWLDERNDPHSKILEQQHSGEDSQQAVGGEKDLPASPLEVAPPAEHGAQVQVEHEAAGKHYGHEGPRRHNERRSREHLA